MENSRGPPAAHRRFKLSADWLDSQLTIDVRSEVLTALTMKAAVCLDVTQTSADVSEEPGAFIIRVHV